MTVAYDSDLQLAQALMLRAAKESPRALDDPPTNVRLAAFGESGVGNVKSDVLNRLWVMFQEHGISLALPQREVRLLGDEAKRG